MIAAVSVRTLAEDLGRLRRHLRSQQSGGDYTEFLWERIALSVGVLDALALPTAAELVRDGETVEDALAIVDNQELTLRRLLGEDAA